ncbi:MAG: hypothetical protein ACLGRW_12270 [Acidobacteriota bacterium]
MIIGLQSLRAGIDWWLENTKWSSEFVNDEYHELYRTRELGINEDWWKATVKRLWGWRAIRAPKPPNTQEEINRNGRCFIEAIAVQYRKIREKTSAEPSIEQLSWEEVAPLFGLALEIKNGSQVFACKMCHFLFPKLFLVIDNWATGVMDYEFCWRGMKEEWGRFSAKHDARRELQGAIKSQKPLHSLYPLETKIMELSLIGYYWRPGSRAEKEDGDTEVILRVGAEGGDVTLVGRQGEGGWRFSLHVDDCSGEFLDEEDAAGLPRGIQASPWVHSWPAAVALLDRYPWTQLSPQAVHPEFREQVGQEVSRRISGGFDGDQKQAIHPLDAARALEDWRHFCVFGD